MQRVKHWVGGMSLVGLLAASLGGCGESSSSKGDEDSDGGGGSSTGGSSTGGTGGSGGNATGGSGGASTGGSGATGGTGSNTGNQTATSSPSGNTTIGTVPGAPIPLEDYPAEVAAVVCGFLTPCCVGLGVPVTETDCSETLGTGFGEEQASADPNNYTYDPEAAGDCVATARAFYDQVSCAGGDTPEGIGTSAIEVCDTVFQGKLEPGAPCAADIECAVVPGEDAECEELDFGTEVTVCVVERRAAEGEPCYWTCTEESAAAYFCSGAGAAETPVVQGRCFTNDQLYCGDGICEAQAPLGAPCADDASCAEGYCSAAGECTTANNEGADCSTDSQCSEGLYCESQICTPKKASGEACTFSQECQSDYCGDDYECAEGTDAGALAFVCALVAAQL